MSAVFVILASGCSSTSENTTGNAKSSAGSSGEKIEVKIESNENVKNIQFELDDFSLTINPTGEIDNAGEIYYSYEVENNAPIPVTDLSLDV